MTRREQADDLLIKAVRIFEKDPNGTTPLMQALTLATLANALLMQESLDQTFRVDLEEDDDDEEKGVPW